jgi:hypothetical protein
MTLAHDYSIDTVTEHVGRDFGVTRGVLVDQSLIDQFAECSRDDQWVHVDVERARKSPLGTTIAHGLLTLSLTTAAQYELGVFPSDAAQVLNYGLDKVRFLVAGSVGRQDRDPRRAHQRRAQGFRPHAHPLPQHRLLRGQPRRPVMVAESLYMLMA